MRELKNVLERAAILCTGTVIGPEDLPRELRRACDSAPNEGSAAPAPEKGSANTIEDAERALIVDALDRTSGNISAAARILGVTRNTLRYRVRKYKLETDRMIGGSEPD